MYGIQRTPTAGTYYTKAPQGIVTNVGACRTALSNRITLP